MKIGKVIIGLAGACSAISGIILISKGDFTNMFLAYILAVLCIIDMEIQK